MYSKILNDKQKELLPLIAQFNHLATTYFLFLIR